MFFLLCSATLADKIPVFDYDGTCRAPIMMPDFFASCVADEKAAFQTIKREWSNWPEVKPHFAGGCLWRRKRLRGFSGLFAGWKSSF